MDFALSQQQSALQESVQRYCRAHYLLRARQQTLQTGTGFNAEHWAAFADLGWLGAALPAEAGGYGESVIEIAIILEEFGKCLVVEPYLACAVLAAQAVWLATQATGGKPQLLEPLIDGRLLLALAHVEREHHCIGKTIKTVARDLPDGHFALSGRKAMVLGGDRAEQFVVSALLPPNSPDLSGVTLFLVDAQAPGLSRRKFRTLDGSGAADLLLNEVVVGPEALIGTRGGSQAALAYAVDAAILGLCAEAVGSMDQVISTTAEYLKTRRAYGSTLSTFQSLQHQLADMLVEAEMSRSILHRALAAFSQENADRRGDAVSSAKALIGRSGKFVAARGVQLHGGMGMVEDYIIGQLFKRLTVVEALFGDSDYHLDRRFHR